MSRIKDMHKYEGAANGDDSDGNSEGSKKEIKVKPAPVPV